MLLPASAQAFGPIAQYGPATPGATPGQLDTPEGVAIGPDANVYVSDVDNNRIDVFAPGGSFLRSFGAGQVDVPEGLAVDAAGNVYVASEGDDRIVVFNSQGALVRSFGGMGAGAGQLHAPEGVALDSQGNLYVPDFFNARISVFTPQGSFVRAFGWGVSTGAMSLQVCTTSCLAGISGGGAGQLGQPRQAAVDAAGNLYVADDGADRVEVFTTQGAFVRAFGYGVSTGAALPQVCTTSCQPGIPGAGAGQFDDADSVAVDAAGNLFIPDAINNRVSVFTGQGTFLRAFGWDVVPGGVASFETCDATTTCKAGVPGGGAGQLTSPFGDAIDCRGALYVSDQGNNRVQRFGEPGTRLPPCPSNAFSFGKLKKNKKRGTALLTVIVPGAGKLALSGKGLKAQRSTGFAAASRKVSAAGKVKLLIKAKGGKKRKLSRTGKLKVRAKVTFTPINGDPNTKSKRTKLLKRLRRQG